MDGTCHCGQAGWTLVDDKLKKITACNCTLCRRYGALWAYGYEDSNASFFGDTRTYTRAEKADPTLEILFCIKCGGVIGYRALKLEGGGLRKIAVNVRLAQPDAVRDLELEHFDGLESFDDLPNDGRRVRDVWF